MRREGDCLVKVWKLFLGDWEKLVVRYGKVGRVGGYFDSDLLQEWALALAHLLPADPCVFFKNFWRAKRNLAPYYIRMRKLSDEMAFSNRRITPDPFGKQPISFVYATNKFYDHPSSFYCYATSRWLFRRLSSVVLQVDETRYLGKTFLPRDSSKTNMVIDWWTANLE